METNRVLRRTLRQLAMVGCLLIAGMALGAWPLAGALIMVLGTGTGLTGSIREARDDRRRQQ